jgi:hypothetical protein
MGAATLWPARARSGSGRHADGVIRNQSLLHITMLSQARHPLLPGFLLLPLRYRQEHPDTLDYHQRADQAPPRREAVSHLWAAGPRTPPGSRQAWRSAKLWASRQAQRLRGSSRPHCNGPRSRPTSPSTGPGQAYHLLATLVSSPAPTKHAKSAHYPCPIQSG